MGGSLRGRLICEAGTPFAGIEVAALRPPDNQRSSPSGFTSDVSSATTDEQGYFELTGLPGNLILLGIATDKLGPFAVGSNVGELLFPGRRLRISIEGDQGVLPENTCIQTSWSVPAGGLGHRYIMGSSSLSQGQKLFFDIGVAKEVTINLSCSEGLLVERVLEAPEGTCEWKELIPVPSLPSTGMVELMPTFPERRARDRLPGLSRRRRTTPTLVFVEQGNSREIRQLRFATTYVSRSPLPPGQITIELVSPGFENVQ